MWFSSLSPNVLLLVFDLLPCLLAMRSPGAPAALQGARVRGDDGGHPGAAVSDDRPDVSLGPDQRALEAPGLPRAQGCVGRTATQRRPGPAR
jgi:hypothetical protein